MRIRILKPGRRHAYGEVLDLPPFEALRLVAAGEAVMLEPETARIGAAERAVARGWPHPALPEER